jgi:hypothetical protein
MARVHPSFILRGQRAAAAFIGSSLTCCGGVVAVEAQPTLIATTAMQKRIVGRRRRRLWSIDIVLPKIAPVCNVHGFNRATHYTTHFA